MAQPADTHIHPAEIKPQELGERLPKAGWDPSTEGAKPPPTSRSIKKTQKRARRRREHRAARGTSTQALGGGHLPTNRAQEADTPPQRTWQDWRNEEYNRLKQEAKPIKHHETLRIATYNCQNIQVITKRDDIKNWAKKRSIDILVLTETHVLGQAQEGGTHEEYTTFFSSDPDECNTFRYGRKSEEAGVAIMIRTTMLPSILSIRSHGSRLMSMRLRTTPPTRYIAVYMPQACGATWETKSEYYDKLNEIMDTMPKHEPLYILGDFNARLQARP